MDLGLYVFMVGFVILLTVSNKVKKFTVEKLTREEASSEESYDHGFALGCVYAFLYFLLFKFT